MIMKKKKLKDVGEKTTAEIFRFIVFFPIPAIIILVLWILFA